MMAEKMGQKDRKGHKKIFFVNLFDLLIHSLNL